MVFCFKMENYLVTMVLYLSVSNGKPCGSGLCWFVRLKAKLIRGVELKRVGEGYTGRKIVPFVEIKRDIGNWEVDRKKSFVLLLSWLLCFVSMT